MSYWVWTIVAGKKGDAMIEDSSETAAESATGTTDTMDTSA